MSAYSPSKLLFLHIPKNAGTSVRSALANFYDGDWIDFDTIDASIRDKRHPAFANHFPYRMIHRMMIDIGADEDQIINTHKVMVVRNPYQRMVSLYFHRMRKLHWSVEGKPRNTEEEKRVVMLGFVPWLTSTPHPGDRVLTREPQFNWGKNLNHQIRFVPFYNMLCPFQNVKLSTFYINFYKPNFFTLS